MSNRTEKLRAIFLTVVMFGSVLALGAMAAAPAAAAPPAQEDVGADIPEYSINNPGAYDYAVASGGSASDLPSELQDDFSDSEVFTDIDSAVGALSTGDNSILVTDGTYNADPGGTLDSAPEGSLTIASYNGPGSTTIAPSSGDNAALAVNLDSSTDLTIRGFTLNGNGAADTIALNSGLNSLTLAQNIVTAGGQQIVHAEAAIGSVTLGYNEFDGNGNGNPALDFYTTIDEVDVNNNVFDNVGASTALQFQGASDVTVQSNDFTDIGDEAVFAATDDSSATGTYQVSQNLVTDVADPGGEGHVFGFYATTNAFSADITVENNVGTTDDENNGGIVNVESSGADVTSEAITIQDNGFSGVDLGTADAAFDIDSSDNTFNDGGDISVTDVTIADNNVSVTDGSGSFVNVAETDNDNTDVNSLTVSNSGNTVYDGGDNGVSGIVVSAGNGAVDSVTVDGVSFADLGAATALDLSGDGTTTATVTNLAVDGIDTDDVIHLDDGSLATVTLDGVDAANVSQADGLDIDSADTGSQNFDLTFADTFTVDGVGDTDDTEKVDDVVNLGADVQSNVEVTNIEGSNVTNGVVATGSAVQSGFTLNINNVDLADVGDTNGNGVGISVDDAGIGDLNVSSSTVTLDNAGTGVDIQGVSSSAAQTSVSVTGIDVTGSGDSADGVVVNLANSGDNVASLTVDDISATDVGASGVVYGTSDVGDGAVSLSNVAVDNFGTNGNEAGVDLVGTNTNTLDEVAVDTTAINNSGSGAAINVQSGVQASTLTLNGSEASNNGDTGTGFVVNVDNIDTVVADSITAGNNNNGFDLDGGGSATVNVTNANISDNGNNGIDATFGGAVTLTLDVEDSTFSDNGAAAVQLDDAGDHIDSNSVIDLSRNYWGNVTGPSIEDNGNGLTASETRYANGGLIDDQGADSSAEFDVRPFLDADGNEVFAFDGIVEDADNSALSGEDVTIEYEGVNTASSGSYTFQGTSNNGEFVAVVDDFQSTDQFEASASVTGFGPSDTQSFSITGDAYVTDRTGSPFTLTEGATLEGTINDSSGNAVANVNNLKLINADTGDVIVNGFSTNLQGEYSVSFSPGTYDLRVNHPNYDSSDVSDGVELTSGNTTTADFALKKDTTATLTATINDADGNAVSNTDVTLSTTDSPPSSNDAELPTTATTNNNGQVTVEIPANANNQAYNVVATADGYNETTRGVAPAPGDSISRTFTLGNASSGSPLDGAAGEYDSDGDGSITASELGDAVNAFGQGNLTAAELGDVVNAFGQS